jgi:hypothetical protein
LISSESITTRIFASLLAEASLTRLSLDTVIIIAFQGRLILEIKYYSDA